MSDLIKRKSIRNLYACLNPNDRVLVGQVLIDIDAIPSVDVPTTMTGVIDAIREAEYRGYMKAVEDIPKGEWIDMGDFEQCSVCKGTHLKEFQTYYGKATWIKTDFCPSCGADMRGERSGTDKDKFEQ